MKGNITRRGKGSWRIKYDLPRDPQTGERRIAYKTVRGKRADAEKELRDILHRQDRGISIDPSQITIAEYLENWLAETAPQTVAPKALERYAGLVRYQINPYLGVIQLQKLRPADVSAWIQRLVASDELSIRSIRHAHGVLRTALNHAAAIDLVERNVASVIRPPALQRAHVEILTAEEIGDTLAKLEGHPFRTVAAFAIGTGARRGEIAALLWSDVDLDNTTAKIDRSLEQTKQGLRVKMPKTAAGRRVISLPAFVVEALRNHRREQLELRLKLGAGTLPVDAPVFGDVEGNWLKPHLITNRWRRAVANRKLRPVSFHALRHTHASALINAGLDVVSVGRRLGHASPALTLNIYAHLFNNRDDEAAAAIDALYDGNKK